ncbi:GNAT family N-acetyltransferase [Rhizobium leguminosarum]|uniref:GNAT family N-acetyltransferase n=1 Tax=Rhizobium ruizarguesonis TaxID=2081791 RepID=UPI0013EECCE9|nr:GNAT family N-acetyltransferase [Rhizobium leguminosarum]QSZ04583.1 GNAT family N-acetyltransferase [Rhizobium ruizarguesonis]
MNDVDQVSDLFKEYYHWDNDIYREWAMFCLKQTGSSLFVAEQDGHVVGFARLDIAEAKVAQLRDLYVVPSHCKNGIGAALIRAGEEWARGRHLVTLTLNVDGNNCGAINLYTKNGFAIAFGKAAGNRPIPPYHFRMTKTLLGPSI